MALVHREVTLLDFDETFDWQPALVSRACCRVDMRDVAGTRLFCTEEAFDEIRRRLSRRIGRGVTFLGSGDRHYVTLVFLAEIGRPFDLVLFDRHADMAACAGFGEDTPGLLSCGTWLDEAFERLPNLRKAILIGLSEEAARRALQSRWCGRLVVLPGVPADGLGGFAWFANVCGEEVYISVDKDVLDRAFAATNWDHGSVRLDVLTAALRSLVRIKSVIGADVCGEMPAAPMDRWRLSRLSRLNERANVAILDALLF